MDDKEYVKAFEIISEAGDSKALSMEAVQWAKKGDFEKALECLKAAREKMNSVHDVQTDMFTEEANGNPAKVNIILVHAQDHLTMSIMAYDNAEMMIDLYKELQEMKRKMDE